MDRGYGSSGGRTCFALKNRLEHPFFGYIHFQAKVCIRQLFLITKIVILLCEKEMDRFNHGVNTGNNIAARALGG